MHTDSSPSFVGIDDPRVEHCVQLQSYVVSRDGALTGDLDRGFFQALDVCDPLQVCQHMLLHLVLESYINDGYQYSKAW